MMKSKKGQISMDTVVYIAIAVLVLVLIVMYVTGMFGNLFGQQQQITDSDLESIKDGCNVDCNTAKIQVDSSGKDTWASSSYCTEIRAYDSNGDDVTENYYCWQSPILTSCTKTITTATGSQYQCSGGTENRVGDVVTSTQCSCAIVSPQ